MFAKPLVAFRIALFAVFIIVWPPIEFDDQTMLDAKEIGDVAANRSLTPELYALKRPASQ